MNRLILVFLLSFFGIIPVFGEELEVIISTGENYASVQGSRQRLNNGAKFELLNLEKTILEVPGTVIFSLGNRFFQVQQNQKYSLAKLTKDKAGSASMLAFLKNVLDPKIYQYELVPRGEKQVSDNFKKRWGKLVSMDEDSKKQLSKAYFLSLIAYYERRNDYPKVAYLVDQLEKFYPQFPQVQSLRGDTLTRTSFREIQNTIRETTKNNRKALKIRKKAVLIGINDYENPVWQNLKSPLRDIEEIKRTLIQKYHYSDEEITLLKNATYQDIVSTLIQLKKEVKEDTSLFIYYAGHGYYPKDEDEGYWIPKDAGGPETQQSFISSSSILGKIKALETQHTLLVVDACFSGNLVRKTRGRENVDGYYLDLSQRKSRQIITSGGVEPVLDNGDGKHSIFATQFLNILKSNEEPTISASELALNLRKGVKNVGAQQTPEYGRLRTEGDENGEFFFVQGIPKEKVIQGSVIDLEPKVGVIPEDENVLKVPEILWGGYLFSLFKYRLYGSKPRKL